MEVGCWLKMVRKGRKAKVYEPKNLGSEFS